MAISIPIDVRIRAAGMPPISEKLMSTIVYPGLSSLRPTFWVWSWRFMKSICPFSVVPAENVSFSEILALVLIINNRSLSIYPFGLNSAVVQSN